MSLQFPTGRLAHAALIGALLAGTASAAFAQDAVSTAPRSDAASASADTRLQALEDELATLRAQVADLKAATVAEIAGVRETAAAKPAASAVIANGKPGIVSADGRFTANFHVVTQLDAGEYFQASPGATSTDLRRSGPAVGANIGNVDLTHARQLKGGDLFRRARLGIDGVAFGDWDYRILLDLGGSGVENAGQVYETWVQYSGLKPFKFRVGAFSPSLGLDDQASTSSMPFLERAAVSDIVRGMAAGDTRTAVQAFAGGDHWLANLAVTGRTVGVIPSGSSVVLTSTPSSTTAVAVNVGPQQTYGDQFGVTARLAATPIHGSDYLVHVGVNASDVLSPPNTAGPTATGGTALTAKVIAFANTQELRVDGTKLINTGNINAKSADTETVEFAAQKQNFLVQGEYSNLRIVRSDGFSSPNFRGYYVSGTWVLTGERRAYNAQSGAFDAIPVAHPFSLKGGTLGAWELGVRYSDINLNYHSGAAGAAPAADGIRGGEEKNTSVALNWYPNSVVRFMVDYAHVDLSRLSPNATLYQTSAGAQIGQHYDVLSGRAQFAF